MVHRSARATQQKHNERPLRVNYYARDVDMLVSRVVAKQITIYLLLDKNK